VPQSGEQPDPVEAPRPHGRYTALPEGVRLQDTRPTHQSSPPPDPEAGRDTDRDFMLRYSG
jgi:hypothetical protein